MKWWILVAHLQDITNLPKDDLTIAKMYEDLWEPVLVLKKNIVLSPYSILADANYRNLTDSLVDLKIKEEFGEEERLTDGRTAIQLG